MIIIFGLLIIDLLVSTILEKVIIKYTESVKIDTNIDKYNLSSKG